MHLHAAANAPYIERIGKIVNPELEEVCSNVCEVASASLFFPQTPAR